MKSSLFTIMGLSVTVAGTAAAQCSSAPIQVRQACKASVDLVNYMTPQLATAIAGGSSTLGQSGALGGFGRFAVSIRGTAVINGGIPNVADKGFNLNDTPQLYAVDFRPVPGAGVDAALGLYKGLNLGATHIGAVDLIISALYLPDVAGEGGDFSIKAKDGNLKLGYGVRVGLLDETIVTPGLYLSYLQRDLPTVSLVGSSSGSAGSVGGTLALNDFSVKTTAIRLVAAKNLLIFGVQAGIGQDTYSSSANIAATVSGQSASGKASMSMTRTNLFVGATINLLVFKLVAEAGQVSGGSMGTLTNRFDKPADGSRTYLSGGLRIAF